MVTVQKNFKMNNRLSKFHLHAFTLVELLVVISIIALLLGIMMPALGKARESARAVKCSAQMKQWGLALCTYSVDNRGEITYFGDGHESNPKTRLWFEVLAPYISKNSGRAKKSFTSSAFNEVYDDAFRICPSAKKAPPSTSPTATKFDCYIGVLFGLGNNATKPLKAPFYYQSLYGVSPALKLTSISELAKTAAFMECRTISVFSPLETDYKIDYDHDLDGKKDSSRMVYGWGGAGYEYNSCRAKIHGSASNIGFLDGHVKKIAFRELFEVDSNGNVLSEYWKIKKK